MLTKNQKNISEAGMRSPERMRFRCQSLKLEEGIATVKKTLLETLGILNVECNKRIGSVLVVFDKTELTSEQVTQKITDALNLSHKKIKTTQRIHLCLLKRSAGTFIKRAMIVSGIMALVSLYSVKKHRFYGVIWLMTMFAHAYQYRRQLFE